MQPNGTTTDAPMAHPTVTIGARTFVVKFNQYAEYLISMWGYDLSDLLKIMDPKSTDPHRLAYTFQLFAACVAHNFRNAIPPEEPYTAEKWMQTLPEDEPEVMTNIGKAVGLALVKRWSDRNREARPEADSGTASEPESRTVEQRWIEREAFATSPMGLGLSRAEFWDSNHRELAARRKVWNDRRDVELGMFAQLRADIHNSSEMLQRKDKRRWEAADFGARQDAKRVKDIRRSPTPQQVHERMIAAWGTDGKGKKKKNVWDVVQGKRQTIPKPVN